MRTSSRLIPPSLCELQDLSDICSNTSNPNIPKNEFSYALPQDPSESNLPYTHIHIRINGPDGQDHCQPNQLTTFANPLLAYTSQPSSSHQPTSQKNPSADTITLNGATTGYTNLKDRFGQEEIVEAFRAIDVNKDGVLTKQDLVVFLDYVGEQYTDEEVDEMVGMFNSDQSTKGVTLEEFRRLATGEIIGLGNSFMMDKDTKRKEAIYKNIRSTGLKDALVPDNEKLFLDALKSETINIAKFKQQREKPYHKVSAESKEKKASRQEVQIQRPAFTQDEHLKRRSLFQSVVKIDVETVISNFNEAKVGSKVTLRQLAKILELPEIEATKLYPKQSQILSKIAIIQLITYSPLKKSERLQLALSQFSSKNTISLNDLTKLLRLMQANDPKLESKLQTIWKKRGLQGDVTKQLVLELMTEYSSIFLF